MPAIDMLEKLSTSNVMTQVKVLLEGTDRGSLAAKEKLSNVKNRLNVRNTQIEDYSFAGEPPANVLKEFGKLWSQSKKPKALEEGRKSIGHK